ncbi:MAG: hypothetical protein KKA84_01755 [Bacteroidetes bacterium]|nr:hypothetical protein [Bacteroidota bacterium]
MRIRKIFIFTSWIPLAYFIIVRILLYQFENHTTFGKAKLLFPAIAVSAITGLIGVVLYFRERNKGNRDFSLMFATLLAGSVAAYYFFIGF